MAEDAASLLECSIPRARSDALDVFLVCGVGERAALFSHVLRALGDPHPGVKRSSMEYVAVAHPEQIVAGVDALHGRGEIDAPCSRILRAIGEDKLGREEAVALVGSTDEGERRLGLIALTRGEGDSARTPTSCRTPSGPDR